jgi:hypothetical protein
MICERCGQREATHLLLTLHRVEDDEVPPPPPDLPVEFQEPHQPAYSEPNVCAECFAAATPDHDHEFLRAVMREREEAMAARLREIPQEAPSPVAIELTESVMLASTAEPVSVAAVRASLIALGEFLASTAGRTHANCVTVSRLLDRVESWRRVNRNRARWQYLPEEYQELLRGFGCLDMTFADPEYAEDTETTPEQLLSAARALRVVDRNA